jgi:ABC-type nitrate/sulfonate/bicarbonate transport system substrate-binding protein
MISAAIVNKTWLEQNLALAQRVVTALRAAAAWGNQNVKLSSDLVSKYTKVPPELVARTPRAPLAVDNDPRMMQPPIDALAKYGFIPRRFAAAEMIAKGV